MSDRPKGSLNMPWLHPILTQEGGCRTLTFVIAHGKKPWRHASRRRYGQQAVLVAAAFCCPQVQRHGARAKVCVAGCPAGVA